MIILGVNISHDGSVAVIKNGKLVFYQEEERVTHVKHTTGVAHSVATAIEKYDPDHIVFVGALPYELDAEALLSSLLLASGKHKHFTKHKKYVVHHMRDHHLAHAYTAFYNSGFTSAAVVVIDGAGQAFIDDDYLYRETETIFLAQDNDIKPLSKNVIKQYERKSYNLALRELKDKPYFKACSEPLPTGYEVNVWDQDMSIGKIFSKIGIDIFGGYHNAGKVMGMAAYGKHDANHPKAFNDDGSVNKTILSSQLSKEDLCFRVQNDALDVVNRYIDKASGLSLQKNICLTGGYFLNCVNNFKYLTQYPNLNFYVEPNSSDSGTAIGAAYYVWKKLSVTNSIKKITNLYLGQEADYGIPFGLATKETGVHEVASIIASGKPVAIYQGKAEAGPRALGNRSILFDPRVRDAKEYLNKLKGREEFRPFAGAVIEEVAPEWFNLEQYLDKSPDMMYAVPINEDKIPEIPGIDHPDHTCRIQTVSAGDNIALYALLYEFFKITGIPIIMNTSFNKAGDTLVNTMAEAVSTCRDTGIPFLYCPEISTLIMI